MCLMLPWTYILHLLLVDIFYNCKKKKSPTDNYSGNSNRLTCEPFSRDSPIPEFTRNTCIIINIYIITNYQLA